MWRGGGIATMHEKGDSPATDNYRDLLISDHLSKALTSIIDDHVNPHYVANISNEQCGGVLNKGTDFASHIVRSAIDLLTAYILCSYLF